ncbi:MAG TPA: zinc ribbon domain-containing protein [Actinophytocola sp.]|uniref:zinc ribbon domain-containing protein n=1 Tax=Actinophytocola sp. TaxID=1872138 RepID=UPI002DBB55D9|nr:zinc ribbon domain-containing protein [Actinophytocola sp.]HEU5474599.1 zinc ribbon domain-containing protein [Actinophytocola sp.]
MPTAGPPKPPAPPAPPESAPSGPPANPGEVKALVAPITGAAIARPEQPEEVVPQEARKKVAAVRRQPPSRRLKPGDLICGDCGEGNPETRKFCSRCGASLLEAEKVKTPWWRRLLPRRGAKIRKSGERPKKGTRGKTKAGLLASGTFKVVRRIVTVAVLLGTILYAVFAPFRGWVNQQFAAAKHQVEVLIFPQFEPVSPTANDFQCPAELPPNNGCAQATDGFSNTYWLAPVNGPQPVVVLKFDRTVDLARIIVRNGANDDFQGNHRARKFHLVFSTGKTTDVNLLDNPDPNTYEIENGDGATSVEIHVVELFQSVKGQNLAVSEIELFERK